MSEFDAQKFYGFTYRKDPTLWTTTRNYEFKYAHPEQLNNVIEKVQHGQQQNTKKKSIATCPGKLKKPNIPNSELYPSNDDDVETHISYAKRMRSNVLDSSEDDLDIPIDMTSSSMECDEGTHTQRTYIIEKDTEQPRGYLGYDCIEYEQYPPPKPKCVEVEASPRVGKCKVKHVGKPIRHIKYIKSPQCSDSSSESPKGTLPNKKFDLDYDDSDCDYDVIDDSEEYRNTKSYRPKFVQNETKSYSKDCGDMAQFSDNEPVAPWAGLRYSKNMKPKGIYSEQLIATTKPKAKTLAIDCRPLKKKITKSKSIANAIAAAISKYSQSPKNRNLSTARSHLSRQCSKASSLRQLSGRETVARMSSHPRNIDRSKSPRKNSARGSKSPSKPLLKMTPRQERTIEFLDKLRLHLLELHIPDSEADRAKREKNGFEFSVRFSRNFLFPLKRLIEDLRDLPAEQLKTARSNNTTEAGKRVSAIYKLIHQSLHAYQKQSRFFLYNQVPQKLAALVEMIHAANKVCIHKGIFDKSNKTIECLQDRCLKFVGFLQDLQQNRKKNTTARDKKVISKIDCRKQSTERLSSKQYKIKTKMTMNKLNMYEPKLAPKKKISVKKAQPSIHSWKLMLPQNDRDEITTQVQSIGNSDSSDLFHHPSIKSLYDHKKAIIEAKKSIYSSSSMITKKKSTRASKRMESIGKRNAPRQTDNLINKNQLRIVKLSQQVNQDQIYMKLLPVIEKMGVAFDDWVKSDAIEAVLNAFDSKLGSGDFAKPRKSAPVNPSGQTMSMAIRNMLDQSREAHSTKKRLSQNTYGQFNRCELKVVDDPYKPFNPKNLMKYNIKKTDNNLVKTRTIDESSTDGNCTQKNKQAINQLITKVIRDRPKLYSDTEEDDDFTASTETFSPRSRHKTKQQFMTQKQEKPQKVERVTKPTSTAAPKTSVKQQTKPLSNTTLKEKALMKHPLKSKPLQRANPLPNKQLKQQSYQLTQPQTKEKRQQPSPRRQLAQHKQKLKMQTQDLCQKQHPSSKLYRSYENEDTDEEGEPPQKSLLETSTTSASLVSNQQYKSALAIKAVNSSITSTSSNHTVASAGNITVRKVRGIRPTIISHEPPKKKLTKKRRAPPPAPTVSPSSSAYSYHLKHDAVNEKSVSNHDCVDKDDEAGGDDSCYSNQKSNYSSNLDGIYVNNQEEGSLLLYKASESRFYESSESVCTSAHVVLREKFPAQQSLKDKQKPESNSVQDIQNTMRTLKSLSLLLKQTQQNKMSNTETLEEFKANEDLIQRQQQFDKPSSSGLSEPDIMPDESEESELEDEYGGMLRSRNRHLEKCSRSRFYANPNYPQPWKVFSEISKRLTNDIVSSIEKDFTDGVSKFVQEFTHLETQM